MKRDKKRRVRSAILLFLTVIWMLVIFGMSAKEADESTEISHEVGYLIGGIVVPGFDELTDTARESYAESIDHVVRKTAHFTEFSLLGFLFYMDVVLAFVVKSGFRGMLAWGLGTLYAVSDEVHQLFVPGRSGQVTDVLLDSAGVLTGCFLFFGIDTLWKRSSTKWAKTKRQRKER